MNWLMYIGGWFVGYSIFNRKINDKDIIEMKFGKYNVKLIIWTMIWVWICWRFIK